MSIIITGGTGLIGRALAAELVADNETVIILTRVPERAQGLPAGVRVEQWDGRSAEGWGQLADGAKAIVNLAGAGVADSRWSPERKRLIIDSRKKASAAVVEAVSAAKTKPDVVVQASAVGFYGAKNKGDLTERAEPGDDFLSEVCKEWEASAAAIGDMGIRLVTTRTGVVLSLNGGAFPKILLPFKFFAGGPIGNGKQWFPWIHIADEVAAIRFLIDKEVAPGPYNLTAPNVVTNAEFSKILGQVMGRPAFMPAPAIAFELLFGEMSTVLLDGQKAIPHALVEAGFQFKFPEAEGALRDLVG